MIFIYNHQMLKNFLLTPWSFKHLIEPENHWNLLIKNTTIIKYI